MIIIKWSQNEFLAYPILSTKVPLFKGYLQNQNIGSTPVPYYSNPCIFISFSLHGKNYKSVNDVILINVNSCCKKACLTLFNLAFAMLIWSLPWQNPLF